VKVLADSKKNSSMESRKIAKKIEKNSASWKQKWPFLSGGHGPWAQLNVTGNTPGVIYTLRVTVVITRDYLTLQVTGMLSDIRVTLTAAPATESSTPIGFSLEVVLLRGSGRWGVGGESEAARTPGLPKSASKARRL
jgi:hypothetical protein